MSLSVGNTITLGKSEHPSPQTAALWTYEHPHHEVIGTSEHPLLQTPRDIRTSNCTNRRVTETAYIIVKIETNLCYGAFSSTLLQTST